MPTGKTFPSFEDPKAKAYSLHSFGAHFAEVEWEPEIARLRVSRIFSIFDCGRIINKKAGTNQILGAAVMGVGMALFEGTLYESQRGQPINGNFADYLVATCADLPDLDVTFLDYPDLHRERIRRARHRRDRHGRRGSRNYRGGLPCHRRTRSRIAHSHRRSVEVGFSRSITLFQDPLFVTSGKREMQV